VGRGDGRGHELGLQGSGLAAGGLAPGHPLDDVLAEQPLVAGHADDLAIAEGRHGAGERVAPPREVALVEVVQQHEADRVGDRGEGRSVAS
jgi:hypothetical protein